MAVPDCLRFFADGLGGKDGVDVVQNVIYLCRDCHKYFGKWTSMGRNSSINHICFIIISSSAAAAAPYILLHVESLALQEDHGKYLAANYSKVYIPLDPHKRSAFPFDPPWDEIWRWNGLWAEKRRKSPAASSFSTSSCRCHYFNTGAEHPSCVPSMCVNASLRMPSNHARMRRWEREYYVQNAVVNMVDAMSAANT